MDHRSLGLGIVAVGVVVVVAGALVATGGLSWFGRLPGDLRFGGQNARVYIPMTSMLLVSIVLSVVLWLIGHLR